jgi:hypothetical protein
MSRMFPQIAALAGAAVLSAALAGCGKQGDLERPGPLFGHAVGTTPPAQKQDPNRPVQTLDPRDEALSQTPPATPAAPTPQP